MQEVFDERVNHVAWIPDGEFWLDEYEELELAGLLEPLEIADDTLILIVSMANPRISFAKGVGGAMVSTAATLTLTGGEYISYPLYYASEGTAAFLLHKGSGELIWKNYYRRVRGKHEKPETLFAGFPSVRTESATAGSVSE